MNNSLFERFNSFRTDSEAGLLQAALTTHNEAKRSAVPPRNAIPLVTCVMDSDSLISRTEEKLAADAAFDRQAAIGLQTQPENPEGPAQLSIESSIPDSDFALTASQSLFGGAAVLTDTDGHMSSTMRAVELA